jgi:hypothetical protein
VNFIRVRWDAIHYVCNPCSDVVCYIVTLVSFLLLNPSTLNYGVIKVKVGSDLAIMKKSFYVRPGFIHFATCLQRENVY